MAQPFVTKDNFSTLIQILTWLLLILAALSVIGRTSTKAALLRTGTKIDDNFIHISLVRSLLQQTCLGKIYGMLRWINM